MKRVFLFVLLFSVFVMGINATRIDRWASLRYLAGTWKMVKPEVTNTQQYSFIFNGQFLKMQTKSIFKPTAKKPKGEIHEDMGIFSYDSMSKKVVLRSFHSEGFINIYILNHVSDDGKILTFKTISVENAPPGTKAKLIFEKINNREFKQKFYVAWPNKDYACFFDNHFKKVK